MDNTHIVIIVLLVLLVVGFLAVTITIVVGAAKLVAPIRNVARRVQAVKTKSLTGLKGKAKQAAKKVAQNVRQMEQKLRKSVRSDLRQLQAKARSRLPNIHQLLARGFAILSGNPCAKFDLLWTTHIGLTFNYGMLALSSIEPISPDKQAKMDLTAKQLLQTQHDLGQLMSSCVPPEQVDTLQNLLRDHILIVAQIAAKWRQDNLRSPNSSQPFSSTLVQAWYKNAADTVRLLEMKNGKRNDDLSNTYNTHLDETAAYLMAISQIRGSGEDIDPTTDAIEKYNVATSHIPMLVSAFCNQMKSCS